MTNDERIEKLLNQYGQTISDLPDSYDVALIGNVIMQMTAHGFSSCAELCLHQADVIDRMETAMHNALIKEAGNETD